LSSLLLHRYKYFDPARLSFFFLSQSHTHRPLLSFPTRRSSDLSSPRAATRTHLQPFVVVAVAAETTRGIRSGGRRRQTRPRTRTDRKSTRLNSSHVSISYAVFCLKKKTKKW